MVPFKVSVKDVGATMKFQQCVVCNNDMDGTGLQDQAKVNHNTTIRHSTGGAMIKINGLLTSITK